MRQTMRQKHNKHDRLIIFYHLHSFSRLTTRFRNICIELVHWGSFQDHESDLKGERNQSKERERERMPTCAQIFTSPSTLNNRRYC